MKKEIEDYVRSKIGYDCMRVEVEKAYDKMVEEVFEELKYKTIEIKTQFGNEEVEVINGSTVYGNHDNKILCQYIFDYRVKYKDMSLEEMLNLIDIGLIVYNEEIYCNIDRDISQWIFNNKVDKLLLDMACGYKINLSEDNPYLLYNKYIDLYVTYDYKAKALGLDSDLYTTLYREYSNDKLIITISELADQGKFKGWKEHNIKELITNYCKTINEIEEIIRLDDWSIFKSSQKDIWNRVDRLKGTRNKIELKELVNSKSSFNFKINALDIICKELNIYKRNAISRLVDNMELNEVVELGIKEREELSLGYCSKLKNYGDNEEMTTKYFINTIIRKRIGGN